MVHGRFLPAFWRACELDRRPISFVSKTEMLIEHWDVIQDEATQEQSKSGLPMFGDKFPQ